MRTGLQQLVWIALCTLAFPPLGLAVAVAVLVHNFRRSMRRTGQVPWKVARAERAEIERILAGNDPAFEARMVEVYGDNWNVRRNP